MNDGGPRMVLLVRPRILKGEVIIIESRNCVFNDDTCMYIHTWVTWFLHI